MKKLLSVVALSAIMATGVFAGVVTGEINKVAIQSSGDIVVQIDTFPKVIENDNVNKKELYAMALTAYASHANVKMTYGDGKIEGLAIIPNP